MALKIPNETKVGALAVVSIVLLILGFYYLKGKNLFKTGTHIYAVFHEVNGLAPSDAVLINGLRVGSVYDIQESNKLVDEILVTIKLEKKINIPINSIATIEASPLGSSNIEIKKGNSRTYVQAEDTLKTTNSAGGLLNVLSKKIDPIADQTTIVLKSIDSLVKNINNVIDNGVKNDFRQSLANVKSMSANLLATTATFNSLLNKQHGSIAQSMDNINAFTKNLANNNEKISRTLSNVEKASNEFANISLQKTMYELNNTAHQLNAIVTKIDRGEGSLGQLINDKKLYNNLTATTNSLNILLQDLRVHPKRYVQFSLFGKKDKTGPLMQPLPDSAQLEK